MDKLIIEKLLSVIALGYCRIFWNDDSVELKPVCFRVKVAAAMHRLYKTVLQALRIKAN